MAGVDDDGIEAAVFADVVGAEDRVEEFDEVDLVDEVAALAGFDGVGEEEFDAIHPDVLLSDDEFDADVGFFEGEGAAGAFEVGEVVEFLDAANGDVAFLADGDGFPGGGFGLSGKVPEEQGGEEDGEEVGTRHKERFRRAV